MLIAPELQLTNNIKSGVLRLCASNANERQIFKGNIQYEMFRWEMFVAVENTLNLSRELYGSSLCCLCCTVTGILEDESIDFKTEMPSVDIANMAVFGYNSAGLSFSFAGVAAF